MKKSNIFILLIMLYAGLFFISCDETTAPNNVLEDAPSIRNLELNPNAVEFDKDQDGFNNDTTLIISISAETANNSQGYIPYFSVTDNNGELFTEGDLTPAETNGGIYNSEIQINTKTTSFEQYLVNVMISDESGKGNYAQSTLRIVGIPNNRPVILATSSPDSIKRPSSGEIPAVFTAKVTDYDGLETIEQVLIRVINKESGEVQGSPFQMADDGSSSGDEVANDSTFTWSLPVTPTDENPNRDFDIEFFAIDNLGLKSDTVRTTFIIRE